MQGVADKAIEGKPVSASSVLIDAGSAVVGSQVGGAVESSIKATSMGKALNRLQIERRECP